MLTELSIKKPPNTLGVKAIPPPRCCFIIRLFLLIFGLLFITSSEVFAEFNPDSVENCPGVNISTTYAGGATETNQTKILPLANSIDIKITPTGKGKNTGYVYGLYSHLGKDDRENGWITHSNNNPLISQYDDELLTFIFNKETIRKKNGSSSDISLIPQKDNPDTNPDNNIYFVIVRGSEDQMGKGEKLEEVCKFTLSLETQCRAYPGFTFSNGSDGVGLGFPSNSIVPRSSSTSDYYFTVNQDNRSISISDTSWPYDRVFTLKKSDRNSPLQENRSLALNLHYKDSFICSANFIPYDQSFQDQLSKCQVIVGKGDDNKFNGQITINDLPNKTLEDAESAGLLNIPFTSMDGSSSIRPYLYIIPRNLFDNITKYQTPVNGIDIVDRSFPEKCRENQLILRIDKQLTFDDIRLDAGSYHIGVYTKSVTNLVVQKIYLFDQCHANITIDANEGITPLPSDTPISPETPEVSPVPTLTEISADVLKLCNTIPTDSPNYQTCNTCVSNNGQLKIWTAVGCISTNTSGFVNSFFTVGLGMAGGIALLFFIYGGFLILISAGNEEAIKQGKEIITSAITGLLLIIFSILILQLFASDILKIPGFDSG